MTYRITRRTLVLELLVLLAALAAGALICEAIGGTWPPPAAAGGHGSYDPPPSLAAAVLGAAADGAGEAWRGGWVSVGVLVAIWFAGVSAMHRRGTIIKRWPRLDVGRAWALVSIGTSGVATLVPLAIVGDLDAAAVKVQLALAAGLLMQGDMSKVHKGETERDQGDEDVAA